MSDLLPEDSLDPGSGEFSVGSEADQDESDSAQPFPSLSCMNHMKASLSAALGVLI